ncbi:hypothetical protein A2U01_0058976, partial [Trifolium medium]|nr:hypothetical protein [Trifolium medium]
MEKNQATLIAIGGRVKGVGEASKKKSENSSSHRLQGDAMMEFRHSVKKVELPMFDGVDPAGWILRAEVYFRVQDTTSEVK